MLYAHPSGQRHPGLVPGVIKKRRLAKTLQQADTFQSIIFNPFKLYLLKMASDNYYRRPFV